jgi:hypothetical protein
METTMMTINNHMMDNTTMIYTKVQLLKIFEDLCKDKKKTKRSLALSADIKYQHVLDWYRKDRIMKINYEDSMKILVMAGLAIKQVPIKGEIIGGLIKMLESDEVETHIELPPRVVYSPHLEAYIFADDGFGPLAKSGSVCIIGERQFNLSEISENACYLVKLKNNHTYIGYIKRSEDKYHLFNPITSDFILGEIECYAEIVHIGPNYNNKKPM